MYIEIDTHVHSVASTHAYSTIQEIAQFAEKYGLKGFALTDHAVGTDDSPHIWHFHNLKCLPRKINGKTVLLKGTEANIMDYDGNLDMDENELKRLEWTVASMHRNIVGLKNPTPQKVAEAYINIAKNNKWVDVIGHCTTSAFEFDFEPVLKVCKEYEKFIEINESSIIFKDGSRKNAVEVLKICKKYEIPVVVNTDSHYCELVGVTTESEKLIEQTGFPKKLVANADMGWILEHVSRKHNIDFSDI